MFRLATGRFVVSMTTVLLFGGLAMGAVSQVEFESLDPAPDPDLVRLAGAAADSGDEVTIEVRIGGPTTSQDYYAFAFDLVIEDPTVISYVNGSASVGDFLDPPAAVLTARSGNRVIVGVSKSGPLPGNGTGDLENVVITLRFRALAEGSTNLTFAGSPFNPALFFCSASGPEAINSLGECITSTRFGSGGVVTVNLADMDGDGFPVPEDCNDEDPDINPAAEELPGNFIDENCDGNLGVCDPCGDWSSHGQYVRCVVQDVEILVGAGVLTEEEGDALATSAARSEIGKKGFEPPECQLN